MRIAGIAAGLHAVLGLPPGTEQQVLRSAAWQGLGLHGLSVFRHPRATTDPLDAVVVGYGTPPDHAWTRPGRAVPGAAVKPAAGAAHASGPAVSRIPDTTAPAEPSRYPDPGP